MTSIILKRNCPKCNCELNYTHPSNWRVANRKKSLCRSCRIISQETREKHRVAKLGKPGTPRTEENKQTLREWYKNNMTDEMISRRDAWKQNVTDETKNKLRNRRIGKKASDTTKEKLRNIRLQIVKDIGGFPSYNKVACDFMDLISNKLGLNFQHAMNGGEVILCGYSVDGYDKINNVVFEYDEKRHENLTRKLKDISRTENIVKNIGCEVIRYSERFNRLYKSFPTYSTPINL